MLGPNVIRVLELCFPLIFVVGMLFGAGALSLLLFYLQKKPKPFELLTIILLALNIALTVTVWNFAH